MGKRIFWIVLDSFGIGGASDAAEYGDEGSNTLATIAHSPLFYAPNLRRLGLFHIDGVEGKKGSSPPEGAYGRLREVSKGKDTTIGHWELTGIVSSQPLPTYPKGFPADMIAEFERRIGKKTLCHMPYSGTEVIRDYGMEHMRTGAPIIYTSADSVFQIAANEDLIPLEELYGLCEIAREMLTGKWNMGRVIARPFTGSTPANFKRTPNRHDYALPPPGKTILDAVTQSCRGVIAVGKINDIFAGQGITQVLKTTGNEDGMEKAMEVVTRNFEGLCFINLVDFDMLYGHRNDVDGYARAISVFDRWLPGFLRMLRPDDLLIITADHGCDPGTPSTDHSREDVPLLIAGEGIRPVNLGTRECFGCVANTIADVFDLPTEFAGESLLPLFNNK